MGLFSKFIKSDKNMPQCVEENPAADVNLTKNAELNRKISLRKEIVLDEVKKHNISINTARIVFVLDHSGSMRNMYKDGTVQDVLERIFPIAIHFDDNAEMEFYWFDRFYKELDPVNYNNIDGYVQEVILSKNDHFGGTFYAPVMEEIFKRYAEREKSDTPAFVIFITDGNNSDKKETKDILIKASGYNIFWKFIGIGNEKFEFLEKLDNLDGRLVDNANYISIKDIKSVSDNVLYSKILEEYNDWLEACQRAGIKVK